MERRSKQRVLELSVYTDGSCKSMGKTTFGGWAFIVQRDGTELYRAAGREKDTTNQRMELQAIAEGLKYVSTIRRINEKVIFYSDSAYAINCYQKNWYINWQRNGWVNASGEEVKNIDLWIQIIPYFDNFWYSFLKVAGHSKNYWNELCDEMAQQQAEYLKFNWRKDYGI